MYSNYNPDKVMNVQEEIVRWAEKTVREYHEIASRKEVNLAYYTQSDLSLISEEPELMIVGINPGSGGTYDEQCKNENWSYLSKNPLDKNHLLKGNYCREQGKPSSWENHRKWGYWNGLKRCLSHTNMEAIMEDDSRIIITNASFFSTKKANEIPESLLKDTIPFTLELIEKTIPKHLIFLSGKKCFERLHHLSESSNLIQFEYKHVCGNIYVGKLNGKLCVGIPHPTYKTNEELNLVASVIPFLFSVTNYEDIDVELICKESAKQIKEYEERIHNKKKQVGISDLSNLIEKVISECNLEAYDEKNYRYKLNGIYGITIAKDGYIAIRHIKYDTKGYSNTQDNEVFAIREILKRRGYNTSENVWIGTKTFSQFGNNDNEIIEGICKEIKELKEVILKL